MPQWSPDALRALREKLAVLYDTNDAQRMLLGDLGVTPVQMGTIALSPAPIFAWFRILEWARPRGLLDAIVSRLQAENPNDTEILAITPTLRAPAVAGAWTAGAWKGASPANLEKLLSSVPTLVSVRWLEAGLVCARSVCRLGVGGGYGTGFVIRGKDGDLLITNHHVLETAESAAGASAWFNYEETLGGLAAEVDKWTLDATRFWTSPVTDGDDWTAVGIAAKTVNGLPVRATDRHGALDISPTNVAENERVNIIQHPGGLPKKISCVSNLVAWAGEGRVHYLTDTQPGSSGAPVFNSDWKVVALHHAGESTLASTAKESRYQRNEGIAIALVYQGLKDAGAL
jgi:V8-like Glu-specific endopeptidase